MPFEALAEEGCCRMHYVYLLQSDAVVGQRYVGVASTLKQRLVT